MLSVVLLGTVALAGATAWQARAREAAAESAYPPAGQFVTVMRWFAAPGRILC